MKTLILWDWWDFGLVFKLFKTLDNRLGIDLQIAWFNLFIQIGKSKHKRKTKI
jgi:hypothetical protein